MLLPPVYVHGYQLLSRASLWRMVQDIVQCKYSCDVCRDSDGKGNMEGRSRVMTEGKQRERETDLHVLSAFSALHSPPPITCRLMVGGGTIFRAYDKCWMQWLCHRLCASGLC